MDSADLEVLRQGVAWLESGQLICLVTVVETYGSSPRPPGAMLAVSSSGSFVGSLSGGCVEDDLIGKLTRDRPAGTDVRAYGIEGDEARRMGLPCGGTLRLVVEPIADPQRLRPALEAVRNRKLIARVLHLRDDRIEFRPADRYTEFRFDGERFVSVFGPQWRLLIIGAGQTSAFLARMAQALGYEILVCDPRAEYADLWQVPGTEWRDGMPDDVVRALEPDVRTAVIALTHDPRLDDLALLEALVSDAFYVGALGSMKSNAKRRSRLGEHFGLSRKQLERLHGPVGLPLGGRMPAEIAVAVLAELTAERHGRRFELARHVDLDGREQCLLQQA